jgi:predicted phosphodiesterase
MSKIVVIGDVHGHESWKELIKLNPDATEFVFIGDYFDSFSISHTEQIHNYKEIIAWKESTDIKVTMLIGNHDFHYMSDCGGRYGGYNVWHAPEIGELLRETKEHLQVAYQVDKFLFTHAGVSKEWYAANFPEDGDIVDQINDLWSYDKRSFNHSGMEMYGNYDGEGPMWIRPQALRRNPLNDTIIQVVGHTNMKVIDFDDNHYFIDTLPNEYLVISDLVPVIHQL